MRSTSLTQARCASTSSGTARCSGRGARRQAVATRAQRKCSLPDEDERPRKRIRAPGGKAPSSADQMGLQDWRTVRARLVALERCGRWAASPGTPAAGLQPPPFSTTCWAHELPAPEAGCVLVARNDTMDFFSRSVVLLARHDDHHSMGFVLNKRSPLCMAEVQLNETAADLQRVFDRQPLHLGGPCHMDTLTLLHGFSGLTGAQPIVEGVSYGGVQAAVEVVRSGLARQEDFRLLLGVAGWGPGQLAAEVAAGCWTVAAASPDLLMAPPPTATGGGRPREVLWRRLTDMLG